MSEKNTNNREMVEKFEKEEMAMHEKTLDLMGEMRDNDVNKFIVSLDADANKMEIILGFKPGTEINKDDMIELGNMIFNAEFGFIPSEVFVSDDSVHATAEIVQISHHKTTMQ